MILHGLTLNGISVAFPGEVSIDFDRYPEGLIALVGDNGAGKSTLMAATGPGTLHRIFPRRKQKIADMVAPGVELAHSALDFTHDGHRYRCKVQVDRTQGGKTEAWLWKDDGAEPIAGPRMGEVDDALAEILPSLSVLLASNFSTSAGTGSFWELEKSERKALFIELLGLSHLQEIAERARKRANALTADLERKRDSLVIAEAKARRAADLDTQITARAGELETLTADLIAAEGVAGVATATHTAAREALATATAAAERANADLERLRAEAVAAQQAELDAVAALRSIDELLSQGEHIRAAAASASKLSTEIEGIDAEVSTINADLAPQRTALQGVADEYSTLREEWAVLNATKKAAAAAQQRIAEGEDLAAQAQTAAASLAEWRSRLQQAEAALVSLEERASAEQAANASAALLQDERAGVVARIAAVGTVDLTNPMCGVCPLTLDALQAKERLPAIDAALAALPTGTTAAAKRDSARDAVGQLKKAVEAAASNAATADAALAAQGADRTAAAGYDAAALALAGVEERGAGVKATLDRLSADVTARQARLDALATRRDELLQDRARIADAAAKLPALEAAEQQRTTLTHTITEQQAKAAAAMAAVSAIAVPDVTSATEAAQAAADRLAAAQAAATAAAEALAPVRDAQQRAQGERGALGDAEAHSEELRGAVAALARDASDYALLDKGFGRDGAQALEIANAGPAVTARANDLLNDAWPRFQLRLDTTEPGKKKGVVKEVFDIIILDAEAGRVGKWGSDGEQDFLDETLRLAIALFNAERRGGAAVRTLWRDETTGKLSPKTASRYVQMLRRVRQLGAFHHVLMVSHAEAIWSQADTRLLIADGVITEMQ